MTNTKLFALTSFPGVRPEDVAYTQLILETLQASPCHTVPTFCMLNLLYFRKRRSPISYFMSSYIMPNKERKREGHGITGSKGTISWGCGNRGRHKFELHEKSKQLKQILVESLKNHNTMHCNSLKRLTFFFPQFRLGDLST